jgi:hypothetical protein
MTKGAPWVSRVRSCQSLVLISAIGIASVIKIIKWIIKIINIVKEKSEFVKRGT